ncbi:MAG: hypothetical protein DSZ04_07230 [Sulfurimonas sp.]|nr:MAG: hypothetical protein DSZ04_07230 [Sulfurimonas sp.]
MSWFNFFRETQDNCSITFGKGINASLAPDEEELFKLSYEAFEKKDILNAYELFFKSLINFSDNQSNKNIILNKTDTELQFEIYQGLAKIQGSVTQQNLYAEINIIKSSEASVAIKRYLLERNYQLTYVNYFTDNGSIKLKLYQDNISLSPQKIFFPLRELALNGEHDKEHIKSEFRDIVLENTDHLQKIEEKYLKIKYKYLIQWIRDLEEKVLTLPANDNSGMQSFLYLNILFKIDYLLSVKYELHHKLSKKALEYFSNEHSTIESKNEELKKYTLELKELSYEEFSQNFYKAKYTFDPIDKSSYDDIVIFINESQNKIRWYKNNRYAQVIPTIYNYIAFYSLYNYGMNTTLKKLFHILIEVQNSSFFRDMSCTGLYNEQTQKLSKRSILNKIKKVLQEASKTYPSLTIDGESLNFSSLDEFSNSYYIMLKNLDFEEA